MPIMRVFLLLLVAGSALAKDVPPSLGSCSPYTDYYIYKCQAFRCKLPVAMLVKTDLEMEVIGMEKEVCIYNYKYIIRNPKIPPAEIKMKCALSEQGRLEMSHQFTDYKKGKLGVYINPPSNEILNAECNRY